MNRNKKGFTLVEMLVVIAIVAILSTVAVVGYTTFVEKANESNAEAEAHPVEVLINAALLTNNVVKLKDDIWVVKTDDGYEFTDDNPVDGTTITSNDIEDLTEELTDFDLTLKENGELIYTSSKGIEITLKINE